MKSILITGVSSGIGYDALAYFVDSGYQVFGSIRKESDRQRLNEEFPNHFTCLNFDVTDLAQIEKAKTIVGQKLGQGSLCALVNNAGYAQGGPMALLSDEEFRQQIEVNVFGVRNVTNTFLPLLGACKNFKGQPGKIINISSISGVINTPMNGAYCVAKHAMESLGEVYRRELMMYGIQVASIQPGPIQSKLWNKNANTLDRYLGTDYCQYARNSDQIMRDAQKQALPAAVISSLIQQIIDSKRPKLSYIVTRNKWLNILFAKYTPARIVDYLLFHSMGK